MAGRQAARNLTGMFCEKCGTKASATAGFCASCGARLNTRMGRADPQQPPPLPARANASTNRKVGVLLSAGILFMPYIFCWLTARKGHTNLARAVAFGWAFTV